MADMGNIRIRTSTGATVRLGDIAEVTDSFEEQQDFARLANKSVITLNVIKRSGENLVDAADKIENVIADYKVKTGSQQGWTSK